MTVHAADYCWLVAAHITLQLSSALCRHVHGGTTSRRFFRWHIRTTLRHHRRHSTHVSWSDCVFLFVCTEQIGPNSTTHHEVLLFAKSLLSRRVLIDFSSHVEFVSVESGGFRATSDKALTYLASASSARPIIIYLISDTRQSSLIHASEFFILSALDPTCTTNSIISLVGISIYLVAPFGFGLICIVHEGIFALSNLRVAVALQTAIHAKTWRHRTSPRI